MKKIYSIIAAALLIPALGGCSLNINNDPYAVTTLDISQLLTATEYEVSATFAEGHFLNSNFSAYVHHTYSKEIDNYSLISTYATLTNTWSQAYRYAIKNCDALISNGDANGDAVYAGIGRVLRAHVYMAMTDLWGDIPYSEANMVGIETPKTDSSESIYNDLLTGLNKAIEDFKNKEAANPNVPASNDLFYGGDVDKWIKAANTLKLKLLVQSRLAQDKVTGWKSELTALLAENSFIGDGEDLQFPHSTTKAPMDERKTGFVDEYEGGQKSVFISPWLYETMAGKAYNFKANPLRGIRDPRTNYYWYNQCTADGDAENRTDYRDGAFISIILGSNSGFSSLTQESKMTTLGIYPVGGKYDDGKGGKIGASSGSGVAPDKILQAYSVPFMKAELVLAGETSGDAAALLKEGILSSIYHVNAVTSKADAAAPLIAASTADEFATKVVEKFNAATDNAKKLEIVMTEKWIANFFNPVEAYNDIRRTGYPVLFKGDENNMAWTPYKQTVAAEEGLTSYNLVKILDYPRIMWYPNNETTTNPNLTNNGRIVSEKTVFWDVK